MKKNPRNAGRKFINGKSKRLYQYVAVTQEDKSELKKLATDNSISIVDLVHLAIQRVKETF